jgi:hypothetical protein
MRLNEAARFKPERAKLTKRERAVVEASPGSKDK